ncbi:hypothetical protein E4U41_004989 [Claviceps citrina]|nr:hypothetical protein E4U41_004989 [Claviceps citrina]
MAIDTMRWAILSRDGLQFPRSARVYCNFAVSTATDISVTVYVLGRLSHFYPVHPGQR